MTVLLHSQDGPRHSRTGDNNSGCSSVHRFDRGVLAAWPWQAWCRTKPKEHGLTRPVQFFTASTGNEGLESEPCLPLLASASHSINQS